MFCRARNKYIPERKRSRPNFLFRERTFLFQDRPSVARSDSPDRGKEQSSREKETAETFSIEGILVSCPTDTFFLLLKRHDQNQKSMK